MRFSIYPEIIKQKQFTFADMERDTNNVAANLISLGLFSKSNVRGVKGSNITMTLAPPMWSTMAHNETQYSL